MDPVQNHAPPIQEPGRTIEVGDSGQGEKLRGSLELRRLVSGVEPEPSKCLLWERDLNGMKREDKEEQKGEESLIPRSQSSSILRRGDQR
ncbi:hypothetical protein MMC25_002841 [Agyrium rufum]|nr:hypothetical protein [Agyrium rufum]